MDPEPPHPRRRFFSSSSPHQVQLPSANPLQRVSERKNPSNSSFVSGPGEIHHKPSQSGHRQEASAGHPDVHSQAADGEDQEAIFALVRKNKKLAIALVEKERELASVRAQHDEVTSEKSALVNRLENTRGAIKSLSASYTGLECSFRSLKREHDTCKMTLNEARLALLDIKEIKEGLVRAFEAVQPLFNESGRFIKESEWRHIVSELQNECLSAHQANDHLRVKLEALVGELSYAKERVSELEAIQSKDGVALQSMSKDVVTAGKRILEVATLAAQREKEQRDTLQNAVVLEEKLHASEARVTEFRDRIKLLDAELAHMNEVVQENTRLTALVQATKSQNELYCSQLQAQIETISSISSQLNGTQERKSEIEAANAVLAATEGRLSLELDGLRERNETLVKELQVVQSTLLKEQSESKQSIEEQQDRIARLEVENLRMKEDFSRKSDSFTTLDKRFTVLQERFEDQTLLLRSEKERSGDIQEQLLASNVSHAAEMEALKILHAAEIAKMSETVKASNAVLSKKEVELQQYGEALNNAHSASIEILTNAHKQQVIALEEQLESIKQNFSQQAKLYETQLSTADELSIVLRSQLEKAQTSIFEQKQHYEQSYQKMQSQHERQKEELKNVAAERMSLLQEQMKQLESSSSAEIASIRAELNRQVQAHEAAVTNAEKQATKAAVQEIERLRIETLRLEGELELTRSEANRLAEDAQKVSAEGVKVSEELKARADELETALVASKEKADTMKERYERGLLDEEEKLIVNSLAQATRSMYEQEMVDKCNELRRREYTITALQSKIRSLEATLAKSLKDKGKEQGDGIKSMVGAKPWTSSSPTSVPVVPTAAGEDQASGNQNADPVSAPTDGVAPAGDRVEETGLAVVSSPSVPQRQQPQNFTKLAQEDSEDDASTNRDPLNLGKRERDSSPLADLEISKTKAARRMKPQGASDTQKTNNTKASATSGAKKAANTTTYKVRTRKR